MLLGKFGRMRKINSLKWEKERILITGHTGFKGSWLSLLLSKYGLNVSGLSLQPEEDQNLFELITLSSDKSLCLLMTLWNDEENIIVKNNNIAPLFISFNRKYLNP